MVFGCARVRGAVVHGISGLVVDVEVDVSQGLPGIGIVGLPDTSVAEARHRVRCAIDASRLDWPAHRITVNLTPAEVRKAGSGLDLSIALGVLAASAQFNRARTEDCVFLGELGLDGRLVPTAGLLAMAIAAVESGASRLVVPAGSAGRLPRLPNTEVLAAHSLAELVAYLRGACELAPSGPGEDPPAVTCDAPDLSDVRGHQDVLLALEVAAAGRHHIALLGPPGVGKSMVASRLATILPDLTEEAALECAAIHGVAGLPLPGVRPPVAMPHHSASAASILGSVRGARVMPGAVTLAHHGVLVLDEAPEFARPSLEGLRQPLETGSVALQRAGWSGRLPASFQLVMTANPCPCGQRVGTGAKCRCSSAEVRRYAARLSGPVLDRVDVRMTMTMPTAGELRSQLAESSASIRERVCLARERASWRFRGRAWSVNADIPARALRRDWIPDDAGISLLEKIEREASSLRGPDRILRMAWSLADLAGVDRPGFDHVSAALALRGAWGERTS